MNTAALQPITAQGVSRSDAYRLMGATGPELEDLFQAAAQLREQRTGRIISYSRKVFIPLTNLCRDRCGYCTFARDWEDPRAHTMTPEEVVAVAAFALDFRLQISALRKSRLGRPGFGQASRLLNSDNNPA